FCLLLQSSGIAQALPLPPKQTFVSKSELEAAPLRGPETDAGKPAAEGSLKRLVGEAWNAAEIFLLRPSGATAGRALERRLSTPWPEPSRAAAEDASVRAAQAGGLLPLPAWLMSAVMASSSSHSQAGPPSPPDPGGIETEDTPPAEIANLLEKAGTDQLPLIAGWNLISLPLEPPDPDPATVLAAVASDLYKAEAFDACDPADPWKYYDPADPAASSLIAI
ncbi:MAG: hypothetical protein GY739_19830, partial [Mesoflavibacter sp.]|nr:hypothetical protein [Mesoflavibacter sp.]